MDIKARGVDSVLLLTIIGLTLFGLIALASASVVVAENFRGDTYWFVKHQALYGGTVGAIAFLVGLFTPYRVWRMVALPALVVAIILLILVFVPGLRLEYGGASRWIGVGPVTIQPTEIAKLAFIMYLAAWLEAKKGEVREFYKSVLPFGVVMAVMAGLIILQPDLGTLISLTLIGVAMVFAGGFRWRHLAALAGVGVTCALVLVNTASYRLNRVLTYLHPELDPQGVGYQVNQALLAVGSGGWWGLGLGRSRQKYQYLPEPAGDSIFAIMAEELGWIRSSLVLLAFAVIAWRGYEVARRAPDRFGQMLAVGITTWIVTQMFINVASILALTPLTGIPLPYISYGGSALVTILFASGILLNVSRYRIEA